MEPKAAKGVMAAAEKKRDNLEQMGNANRKITSQSSSSANTATTTITFDHAYQQPPAFLTMDTDEEVDELGVSDNDV
jgi:hypothetical protein